MTVSQTTIRSTTQRGDSVRGSMRLHPSTISKPAIFFKRIRNFNLNAGAATPVAPAPYVKTYFAVIALALTAAIIQIWSVIL